MTTDAPRADDGELTEEETPPQNTTGRGAFRTAPSFSVAPSPELARLLRGPVIPELRHLGLAGSAISSQMAPVSSMSSVVREVLGAQRFQLPSPLEPVLAQLRADQDRITASLFEGIVPRIDTSFLHGLLAEVPQWQELPDPVRNAVADLMNDARMMAGPGADTVVPEETVAEMEQQAAQFAPSVAGPLPAIAQRYLFALFIAGSVLAALTYLSIASDTVNAVLDEAYEHKDLTAFAFVAACYGWDRWQGNRDGADD
ncbi:hypothetical protein ACFC63_04670 [Streptomyces albidoflavus]